MSSKTVNPVPKKFLVAVKMDATDSIALRIMPRDNKGADPEHPFKCAIARCAKRAGFDAMILVTTSYVLRPATEHLIRHNRRRNGIKGVKPGDMVAYRYINSKRVQTEVVHTLDDGGPDSLGGVYIPVIQEGYFELLPPPLGNLLRRDREGRSTRSERADNHRDGAPLVRVLSWSRLERAQLAHAMMRGDS